MATPANSFFIESSSFFAGNKRMQGNLNEFEFLPDPTTEKSTYYLVATLAPSFLIGSFSFSQVTRTTITSRKSSKLDQIRPWTAELAALERLGKSP